jgi:hypothetical protein
VQQIQWVKNFYAKILIVTYLVSEGHNIMQPQNEEHAQQYKDKLSAYLRKAEDIKKSDLANYVSHRKVIIGNFQASCRLS